MKLTCEDYMNQYLELDQNERIPLGLSWHLLTCRECRNQIMALAHAQKIAKEALRIPSPVNNAQITSVVRQIDPAYTPKQQRMPFFQWIIAGVVLVAILIYVTVFMGRNTAGSLSFFLYMGLALMLTGYCAVFVATNLDFFIKKIKTIKLKPAKQAL